MPQAHPHAIKAVMQMAVIISMVLTLTARAQAETLLYANPMSDGSEWSIFQTTTNLAHSFDSGILSVWGGSTSAGSIVFTHQVDTTGFKDIRLEFDYRQGGSIVQWENSDRIRFIVYEQPNAPVNGDPAVAASQFWRNKPPPSWTTRSFLIDNSVVSNRSGLWVGFNARSIQSGEKFQLNNFRVFGTVVPEPSTALLLAASVEAFIATRRPG